MRRGVQLMLLCGAILSAPVRTSAQGPDFPDENEADPNEEGYVRTLEGVLVMDPLRDIDARRSALEQLSMRGEVAPSPIENRGPDLELVRRNRARQDLMTLAEKLQVLYDLRSEPERGRDFERLVARESKDSAKLVRQLLQFVNRGLRSPEPLPVTVPDLAFDDCVQLVSETYLEVLEPAAELIRTDVLDLRKLDQVRMGLARIEAITSTLAQSVDR